MNNGFSLVRLQPKQLLKTGDTMTGNLTMAGGSKVIGNLIGNADTASKLQTPRAINGTNFDGTNPITTAQWGQARNINIASSDGTGGGTTVSINGSTNYTLRLPATIKATLLGNATSASTLQNQRRITINGVVQTFDGSSDINFTIPTGGNYLPLSGGTVTGLTSFTKGIQSGTSVNWKILETGVATFPGVNVHDNLVVSGTASGKGGVGGADTWNIMNNGSAWFNEMLIKGNLTLKKDDGGVTKVMVHRTLNGNDMQGSFDVYATNVAGGHGACALSTNNKTTGQQEACYVFASSSLWAVDVPGGKRPDLGADGLRFKKGWLTELDVNGMIRGKGSTLYLNRDTILLPQGGNTRRECDFIRLGNMFMAGLDSMHFVTHTGNRGVVYAGNFNMSYRSSINSRPIRKVKNVFDIINSVDVIEDEESYKLVNKEDGNARNISIENKCVRNVSDDENVSEDETTIDILNTISLLWKSNQELIEENNKLNERLSKIESKLPSITAI